MYYYTDDNLFPDWVPFEPVRRILTDCGLTPYEVKKFETPFEEFRHQEPDNPLRLPDDVRTSDEWFKLLFRVIKGEVNPYPDPDYIGIDKHRASIEELKNLDDFKVEAFIKHINLDNIGRDFLCLIYQRQRVLDLWREGGLPLVLRSLFKAEDRTPPEHTNFTNSLIIVEALYDFLLSKGVKNYNRRDSGVMMTILSDPPQRHLTIKDIPSPVQMIQDSSNLSRYIRNLSACLQDGGKWEDLIRIDFRDYDLSESFVLLKDRRVILKTESFARSVSFGREFCLWDIYRGRKLPSIRTISENKGIPYFELLRPMMNGYTNIDRPLDRYDGLYFLREGLTDRLAQIFVRYILSESPLSIDI